MNQTTMPSMALLSVWKRLRRGTDVMIVAHPPYGRICGPATFDCYKDGDVRLVFPDRTAIVVHIEDVVFVQPAPQSPARRV